MRGFLQLDGCVGGWIVEKARTNRTHHRSKHLTGTRVGVRPSPRGKTVLPHPEKKCKPQRQARIGRRSPMCVMSRLSVASKGRKTKTAGGLTRFHFGNLFCALRSTGRRARRPSAERNLSFVRFPSAEALGFLLSSRERDCVSVFAFVVERTEMTLG